MTSLQIDDFHQHLQDAGKEKNSLELLVLARVPYIMLYANEINIFLHL